MRNILTLVEQVEMTMEGVRSQRAKAQQEIDIAVGDIFGRLDDQLTVKLQKLTGVVAKLILFVAKLILFVAKLILFVAKLVMFVTELLLLLFVAECLFLLRYYVVIVCCCTVLEIVFDSVQQKHLDKTIFDQNFVRKKASLMNPI